MIQVHEAEFARLKQADRLLKELYELDGRPMKDDADRCRAIAGKLAEAGAVVGLVAGVEAKHER